jgi:hypothetical protein
MPRSRRCSRPRHGASRSAGVAVEHVVVVADGAPEQQPRLLEGLADRGDEEVEAPLRQAKPGARLGVVEAVARRVRIAVPRVDDAAREHPRAAGVVGAVGAARQEHLDAGSAVANDDDRGGRPRRPLRRQRGSGRRERRGVGGGIAHRDFTGTRKAMSVARRP